MLTALRLLSASCLLVQMRSKTSVVDVSALACASSCVCDHVPWNCWYDLRRHRSLFSNFFDATQQREQMKCFDGMTL
jgi:hypothetical protein